MKHNCCNDGSLCMPTRILSTALAVMLTVCMLPTRSFAVSETEELATDDTISEALSVQEEDLCEESASLPVDESIASLAPEGSLDRQFVEDDSQNCLWINSFRYEMGQPIKAFQLRAGSSNFMQFTQGHYQGSDALRGIDVSEHQGTIDWSRVKAAGIDFAIIRTSYGFSGKDAQYLNNIRGCLAYKIPFGIYHYAKAGNAAEARQEADNVKSCLNSAGVTPQNIGFPVYYDIENEGAVCEMFGGADHSKMTTSQMDDMVSAFISAMNASGYKAGIYSNLSWLTSGPCRSSYINGLEYRWVAEYNTTTGLDYTGFGNSTNALKEDRKGIWQFSSSGRVDGISGNVDLNYSYYNKFEATADTWIDSIDRDGGTFRVTVRVTGNNQPISYIDIPVWCFTEGDQDDLRTYRAMRNPDGTYSVHVSIADHKGQQGWYYADPYIYSTLGLNTGVARAQAEIYASDMQANVEFNGRATINVTAKGGIFARAKSTSIAVWSNRAGQDDLTWYGLTKKNNTWSTTVDIQNHGDIGPYTMHLYAVVDGKNTLATSKSLNIDSYIASMFRMYNPNSGEHFYTSSHKERDSLVRSGWKYEGIAWNAPNSSSTPVFRLYSGTDHHYTTSVQERDDLVRVGWKYEGVGWYSDDQQRIPMYRQFNPYVQPWASSNNSGSHHYTNSLEEQGNLVAAGWHAEGIGWFGIP